MWPATQSGGAGGSNERLARLAVGFCAARRARQRRASGGGDGVARPRPQALRGRQSLEAQRARAGRSRALLRRHRTRQPRGSARRPQPRAGARHRTQQPTGSALACAQKSFAPGTHS
jgi:hypothetical protein